MAKLLFLLYIGLIWLQGGNGIGTNTFLQLAEGMARAANKTNCWVCAWAPQSAHSGYPIGALPLNKTGLVSDALLEQNDQTVWFNQTGCIQLSFSGTSPLCRNLTGTTFVWKSSCTHIITKVNGTHVWHNGSTMSTTNLWCTLFKPEITTIWGGTTSTDLCKEGNTTFGNRAMMIYQSDSWNMYNYWWICGKFAYKRLPQNASGFCYLGLVIPAMRIVDTLPPGHIRNKRDGSWEKAWNWIEQTALAEAETTIPWVGQAKTNHDLKTMSLLMEKFMNTTERVLGVVQENLNELRIFTQQNRLALDYLLAAQGGVCGLIGPECCVKVSDVSSNLTTRIKEIQTLSVQTKTFREQLQNWNPLNWLGIELSELMKKVVGGILMFLVLICSIYIMIQLALCCIKRCLQKIENVAESKVQQMLLLNVQNPPKKDYKDTCTFEDEWERMLQINCDPQVDQRGE